MGTKMDAAYYREYRQRRKAAGEPIKRTKPRGPRDRSNEKKRKSRSLAPPPLPLPYAGHPVFTKAAEIVGPPSQWEPEIWQDEMGLVVVALLSRQGERGARAALKKERSTRYGRKVQVLSLEAMLEWTEPLSRG